MIDAENSRLAAFCAAGLLCYSIGMWVGLAQISYASLPQIQKI